MKELITPWLWEENLNRSILKPSVRQVEPNLKKGIEIS